MERYALINAEGLVVNVVIWNGIDEYLPLPNHALVFSPIADIGDNYDFDNDIFIKPDRTGPDYVPPVED